MLSIKRHKTKKPSGYIALISLLMVAVVGLTVGITASMIGIEEIQLSYGRSQSAQATVLASACLEEGLEQLRRSWTNFSKTLSMSEGFCIITVEVLGQTASVEAIGTFDNYHQLITVQVDDTLQIISWEED